MKRHSQQGSSLLEVLVALFVLGVGTLGVLAIQAESLKFNKQALSYSQAMFLANDMMERIRANKEEDYTIADAASVNPAAQCDTANCNEIQLKEWDTQQWAQNLAANLPGGRGSIRQEGTTGRYTIVVEFTISDTDRVGDNPQNGDPRQGRKREFYYLISGV